MAVFTIAITTVGTMIIVGISYFKTRNAMGQIGDTGIRGKQGKQGKQGLCNITCGKKQCYVEVIDSANKTLNFIMGKYLTNLEARECIQYDSNKSECFNNDNCIYYDDVKKCYKKTDYKICSK